MTCEVKDKALENLEYKPTKTDIIEMTNIRAINSQAIGFKH